MMLGVNRWHARVTLVVAFDFFASQFWEVAGTNGWYFVIL